MYQRLRTSAKTHRRSLDSAAIVCLETVLLPGHVAARELQLEAESLMGRAEHEVDSSQVLELVRDGNCSACDCEFVALAMTLGVKLATMDAKLLKAFPTLAVALSVV